MLFLRTAGLQALVCDILDINTYPYDFSYIVRGTAQTMSNYNDRHALDGLQDLDPQAIGAIYDQYFSEVYRYVRYRLEDATIAEDIASDVFVRLLEASHKKIGPHLDHI